MADFHGKDFLKRLGTLKVSNAWIYLKKKNSNLSGKWKIKLFLNIFCTITHLDQLTPIYTLLLKNFILNLKLIEKIVSGICKWDHVFLIIYCIYLTRVYVTYIVSILLVNSFFFFKFS